MKSNLKHRILLGVMISAVIPFFVGDTFAVTDTLLFEINDESRWSTIHQLSEIEFSIGTVEYDVLPISFLYWQAGPDDNGSSLDIYRIDQPTGFDNMVSVLTNGENDHFFYESASGSSKMDFDLSNGITDFQDFEITRFSLVINNITFGPIVGGRTVVYSNVSFQTWGIPEPTTLSLLALGSLAMIRRRK